MKPNATEKDPWAADWAKRNAAGSGPYALTTNTPGVEVVLEARKDHWMGAPQFQKVVFKFVPNEADRVLLLKRKAIDMVVGRPGLSPRSIKQFENDKDFNVFTAPDTVCNWLAMNQTKKPLDNVKVRQAINYAIPVAAIVPNVLLGYGAQMKSTLPALMPGYDGSLSPYKYDLDKAKALMKEAGVTTPVTLDLAVRIGWQPHEEAAVWIQRELEKIGFKINITRQTDATFRQLASKGDMQLSIETWQSWVNDPFFHLVPLFHSTSKGTNTAFYNNPELDKILDDNYHEPDADQAPGCCQGRAEDRPRRRGLGPALERQLDARGAQGNHGHRQALGHVRPLYVPQERLNARPGRWHSSPISCAACPSSSPRWWA